MKKGRGGGREKLGRGREEREGGRREGGREGESERETERETERERDKGRERDGERCNVKAMTAMKGKGFHQHCPG